MPRLYFSRVSHSWVAELIFSFNSDSFFDSASYFGTLLGFDSVSYGHMIRFFFSRLILEVLTLMVIFRALKDKRRVLVLRKGYNV